jgi:hypothetical protein
MLCERANGVESTKAMERATDNESTSFDER